MKKINALIKSIIVLLFLISPFNSSKALICQELEWQVNVGDSKSYTVHKYFDDMDEDGDGDKNTRTIEIGEEEVILKKGTTFNVEITGLYYTAEVNITIKQKPLDIVSILTLHLESFVSKTVNNKSYWEEYVKWHYYPNVDYQTVEGDLIVHKYNSTAGDDLYTDDIIKRSWKTGWVTYYKSKMYNSTNIRNEFEFSTDGNGLMHAFEVMPLFLIVIAIILVLFIIQKRN